MLVPAVRADYFLRQRNRNVRDPIWPDSSVSNISRNDQHVDDSLVSPQQPGPRQFNQLFARRPVLTDDTDDLTLVKRCLAGERAAFEHLVIRYQKPVYNAALRVLRDPEEARDVAQSTFLKAFGHLAEFDAKFKFYSWLYRIAVNESLNTLDRRRPYEQIDGAHADETPGADQRVEGEQARRAIGKALMKIHPDQRTVIVLRHFVHLSYGEIAQALGLPEKTVKSRLFSARQALREFLPQYEAT